MTTTSIIINLFALFAIVLNLIVIFQVGRKKKDEQYHKLVEDLKAEQERLKKERQRKK